MKTMTPVNAAWYRYADGLNYSKAMLTARKVQRDEAKLRALGCGGNYRDVAIRVTFERCHGRKEYGVFVLPNAIPEVRA